MGQLLEGDEYQRLLLAAAASGVIGTFEWDVQSDLLYADANTAAIFCVDAQQAARGLPQGQYMRAVHPDDFGFVASSVQEAIASQTDFECEYRVIQADNSIKTLLGRGRCSVDAEGRPTWFRGIMIDITARKSQKTLPSQEAKDHCIAIREMGIEAGDDFLVHLIDMVLLQLGRSPISARPDRAGAH